MSLMTRLRIDNMVTMENFRPSFQNFMPKKKKNLNLERGFCFLWAKKNIHHQNTWLTQGWYLPIGIQFDLGIASNDSPKTK